MKKIFATILFTGLFMGLCPPPSSAFTGWEANITVTSGNAENRLSFGQRADATDLTDGLYDLPAMLSGTIQIYFQTEGKPLWRDIRAMGPDKEWQLIITSQTGQPLAITWDPDHLPATANVRLVDPANGIETDMKASNAYLMENTDNALLILRLTRN